MSVCERVERQVYLRPIVSRCSAELLTIQTSQKFLDESSYSHRDTKTTLCQVFLRVTVSFRLKK